MKIVDNFLKIQNLILLYKLKHKIRFAYPLLWDDIESLYENEIKLNPSLVDTICSVLPQDFDCIPDEEHGTPGEARYQESGWYKKMLGRYFFAGYAFCRNKNVLDLCSGFGWGGKILANYATNVTCIEINQTLVEKSTEIWKTENITWLCDDILKRERERERERELSKFDVIVAMEAIEHFTKEDTVKIIQQVKSLLKENGIFIASSFYPDSSEQARISEAQNPFHLHIWTKEEILQLCNKFFQNTTLIGNLLLISQNS